MNVSIETQFKVLCEIVRAQHFAWRQAAVELAPGLDPRDLVERMWKITGVQTAGAYLKRIDPSRPLAVQIAESMVWSSLCMGEVATVEAGEGDEAFVRHTSCPWSQWHERLGLSDEDQMGCDTWFFTTVAEINKALGTDIKIETQASLPKGDPCCLRRIWNAGLEGSR